MSDVITIPPSGTFPYQFVHTQASVPDGSFNKSLLKNGAIVGPPGSIGTINYLGVHGDGYFNYECTISVDADDDAWWKVFISHSDYWAQALIHTDAAAAAPAPAGEYDTDFAALTAAINALTDAINGLNDVSKSEITAIIAAALTTYVVPTTGNINESTTLIIEKIQELIPPSQTIEQEVIDLYRIAVLNKKAAQWLTTYDLFSEE